MRIVQRFAQYEKPDNRKKETGNGDGCYNPEQFFINVA